VCDSSEYSQLIKLEDWNFTKRNGLLNHGIEGYWIFQENLMKKKLKLYLKQHIKDKKQDKI
jgi:hypothetical protein